MDKYVKVKFNGKVTPYLLYVDENYVWTDEQVKSENAKTVELAKMAFLDHGVPLIPLDSISDVLSLKAAYTTPTKDVVLLIYEGGNFMTLLPSMEIVKEQYSEYYPIEEGFAVICENDPFDKNVSMTDYIFERMCKDNSIVGYHYLFSFRNRLESELIKAFSEAPAILFNSSYVDVDWWELMLRCIIKSKTKAKVIGKKKTHPKMVERQDKYLELANKFGVEISMML